MCFNAFQYENLYNFRNKHHFFQSWDGTRDREEGKKREKEACALHKLKEKRIRYRFFFYLACVNHKNSFVCTKKALCSWPIC